MITLRELFAKGIENMKARDRAEERIRKAKKYLERLSRHHWKDMYVGALVEALKPYYPDYEPEVLGPFGIGCHISIYFHKKGVPSPNITLAPTNVTLGEFVWIDESSESSFEPRTIGHLNGLGKKTEPLLLSTPIEKIVEIMNKNALKGQEVCHD
jgi:hypothetical protein